MSAQPSFVLGSVSDNGLAVITLDRPKALNAMNLEMDLAFKKYLDEWRSNASVKAVLVESSSPRAFSAGGDVKWMTTKGNADFGMHAVALKVFDAEYTLICEIADYQKPYVSFMDGITMGFGIGLSSHGSYRVVTERTILAMPENGIGLFPDVGFAHIAAHSPGDGAIGAYLALTGARINNPVDALYAGIGTHYVPSQKLALLKEALLQQDFSHGADEAVKSLLEKFSEEPESEPTLKRILPSIISCFGGGKSVKNSIESLRKEELSSDVSVTEWAKAALAGIAKGAPYSLCVTQKHFDIVAAAARRPEDDLATIVGVMKLEYRLALRASIREDFIEGVRAVVVDKDQNPKWKPPSLEEVDLTEIDRFFDPLEDGKELIV